MKKKILVFIVGIGIVYILIVLGIFIMNKSIKKEELPAIPKIEKAMPRPIENKEPDINNKETSKDQEIEREPYQEGPLLM